MGTVEDSRAARGARSRRGARPHAWCPLGSIARLRLLAAALCLAALTFACRATGDAVVVHGKQGPSRVRVELALTADQRARGLMWRDRLDRDAGMLFVFPSTGDLAFWMKNTPLPLDILFIDANGHVVSVAENTTPYSETSIPARAPARYVLEVNAGYAREHGVEPGTAVDLPNIATAKSASD